MNVVLIQASCWGCGPAGMTKAYSMDLRERVVSAVDAEGISRHEAAARFGIAVSGALSEDRKRGATALASLQTKVEKVPVLRHQVATG